MTDLGSTNGTELNGTRIDRARGSATATGSRSAARPSSSGARCREPRADDRRGAARAQGRRSSSCSTCSSGSSCARRRATSPRRRRRASSSRPARPPRSARRSRRRRRASSSRRARRSQQGTVLEIQVARSASVGAPRTTLPLDGDTTVSSRHAPGDAPRGRPLGRGHRLDERDVRERRARHERRACSSRATSSASARPTWWSSREDRTRGRADRHRPAAPRQRGRLRARAAAVRGRRRDGRRAGRRGRLAARRVRDRGGAAPACATRRRWSSSSASPTPGSIERSLADPAASGMGTTATVALVDERGGHRHARPRRRLARLPRSATGRLEQLTDDHSLVAELVRSGRLTEEEALVHPAPLGDHARARHRPDVDVDTLTDAVAARRPRPPLLGRAQRRWSRDETILALVARSARARRGHGGARRRGERRGRRRQRHGRAVRGARGRAARAPGARPAERPCRRTSRTRTSRRGGRRAARRRVDATARATGAAGRRSSCSRAVAARRRARALVGPHPVSARNRELARPRPRERSSRRRRSRRAWIATGGTIDLGWLPCGARARRALPRSLTSSRGSTVPNADPMLLPLAALLCAIGLTFVYRVEPDDGRRQLVWVAVGVGVFCAVLWLLRYDYRVLERYKYVFGVSAIVLLMLPSVPGLGERINGVKLWVEIGPLQFQPGEIAKIFLVLFLAGYLRDKRESLAQGRLKDLGPAARDLGRGDARARPDERPRLGAPQLRDLPRDALRRDRARLLYVARRARPLRSAARPCSTTTIARVQQRVTVWLEPWTDEKVYCSINGELELRQNCDSYQLVKSLYSIANGGYGGTGIGHGHVRDGRRHAADPVPADRLHLLRRSRRSSGSSARRPSCSCSSRSSRGGCASRCSPRTASRSCSPPGSRSASRCRRSSSSAASSGSCR